MEKIQYAISGGQMILDKNIFTRELLLADSPLKKLLGMEDKEKNRIQPVIIRTMDLVTIDYNGASDILLDENYELLFQTLKVKYRDKVKGKVTIRFTCYNTYYVVVNLDREDDKLITNL
jgi:hypothetical protein